MQPFGFEHDPVPEFDPAAHGIDDSYCLNLRPKAEYRDLDTGRRLRHVALGGWLVEAEDGTWEKLEGSPNYVDYVVSDDDSDAAYYLHRMSERHGERVSVEATLPQQVFPR